MSDQPQNEWSSVVEQIRAGDPLGEERLYRELMQGPRFFLQRRLGTLDVDDKIHDVFLIVAQAIRGGTLREPERLMGFIRTVLYRQLNRAISEKIDARASEELTDTTSRLPAFAPRPDEMALESERIDLMRKMIGRLRPGDTEILNRFYIRGQDRETICREMSLSPSQFSVRKTRAKALLRTVLRQTAAKRPSRKPI